MKLSIIDKIKIAARFNSAINGVEEGINMKDATKVILAIVGLLTGILQIPSIQAAVVAAITAHPAVAAVIGGISAVLAVLHVPTTAAGANDKASGSGSIVPLILLFMIMFSAAPARAQAAATPPADPVNLYMAGASYNNGASPAIAGTALYARKLNDSGTYAFTVIDALPASYKPFTVTTNIGAGIAQKAFNIGPATVFIPTAAGISYTGSNVGWAWSTGAGAMFRLPKNTYLMPNVRINKSSIGGAGYQPIVGVLFGWGQ